MRIFKYISSACLTLTATILLVAYGATGEARGGGILYATAHQGDTNIFGEIDLTTGQFTEISDTTPRFLSLTAGAGGMLYGGATDGHLYTISSSGATSPFGTVVDPPSGTTGFWGLASMGSGGFLADNIYFDPSTVDFVYTLQHISADGTSSSTVGTMGSSFVDLYTGNLAFGPGGRLYFDAGDFPSTLYLYVVDPTTGIATPLASNLGSGSALPLASDGTTLFGTTDSWVYSINATTGVATRIRSISGLPSGYSIDAIAFAASVPEPHSIMLLGSGATLSILLLSRRRKGDRGKSRRDEF